MQKLQSYIIIPLISLSVACNGQADSLGKPEVEIKTLYRGIETQHYRIDVETIVQGLNYPWGLAFIDESQVLITERGGRLRLIDIANQQQHDVQGLPEFYVQGQGGLLDVALHPDFKKNRIIFISYSAIETETGKKSATVLASAKLNESIKGSYSLEDFKVLFEAKPYLNASHHFGGRIALNNEYVFLSLGDHGTSEQAQDTGNPWGSIIRLTFDGRVPESNPEINHKKSGIYSYGHRNPQGLVFADDTLYEHEHGPQGGDELNIIHKGLNYGWPLQTYGKEYGTGFDIGKDSVEGMEPPLYQWTPSIAPSGLEYYTGKEFEKWNTDLLVGALKFQKIVRLIIKDKKITVAEDFLTEKIGRIRAIKKSPKKGFIYILTDDADGQLIRISQSD